MAENFINHLSKLLKADNRLVDEEKDIQINVLRDLVNNLDSQLIELLIADEKVREKFFIKVKDVYVFKQNDFIFYLDSKVLDGSYTQYANRIGLASEGKFLTDSTDYVLDFPYKDCVLEGGQSTEEGNDVYFQFDADANDYVEKTAKRKEIFYNNIIAKDEIDRLLEPKAFQKVVRYDANGETIPTSFNRDAELNRQRGLPEDTITDNLIIKGNNLLALHSLEKEFKGKVKLIYIDPPYNPPSNANTFAYNNNFNNSTWLTFMYNRLQVAKKMLKDDGCLIVAIDENEHDYLGVMLRQIFPTYKVHSITIIHNPRGVQGTNFSYTHENAFFVFPSGMKIIGDTVIEEEDVTWSNLRNWGSESLRSDAKNCFYPIIINPQNSTIIGFGEVSEDNYHPNHRNIEKDGNIYIYPIDSNGIERKWRYARQSVDSIKHLLRCRIKGKVWDIEIGKTFAQYKTVWQNPKYDANEYGTKIMKELVPNTKFSFPKSLWTVYDCIHSVLSNDKEGIILDYHAGSGTTGHAVMELNKDGGKRKFILMEQMDYVYDLTYERNKNAIDKYKYSESITYIELAKNNETAKERIDACNTLEELVQLFEELNTRYFLDYNVRIKDFKENVVKEEAFINLSLARQKELFKRMLDNNQLYVNLSEVEDARYKLSEDAIRLTKDFYQIKN